MFRLQKENKSYQKEEEDLARKLEKFLAADNAEAWDIKNTVRSDSANLYGYRMEWIFFSDVLMYYRGI